VAQPPEVWYLFFFGGLMAEYIDNAPDTKEVCCIRHEKNNEVKTCQGDAKVCITAHLKDKRIIYLPICTKRGHISKGVILQGLLVKGREIESLEDLDTAEVFVRDVGEKLKHKLIQGDSPAPAQRPPVPQPKSYEAVSWWEWIDDTDLWMDTTGEIVRISKLSKEEFISAVNTICEVNLSRITKKNAWVKGMQTRRVTHLYPLEAMEVGSANASEKLEEFFEIAEDNGWV
jgi:hypothetical protein